MHHVCRVKLRKCSILRKMSAHSEYDAFGSWTPNKCILRQTQTLWSTLPSFPQWSLTHPLMWRRWAAAAASSRWLGSLLLCQSMVSCVSFSTTRRPPWAPSRSGRWAYRTVWQPHALTGCLVPWITELLSQIKLFNMHSKLEINWIYRIISYLIIVKQELSGLLRHC